MLLVVFLDVVEEFFAFEDLDVGGEAEDEAGGAFEAVDGGGEDPFAVDAFEVFFGQGVFLHEEGLGAGVELEGDGFDGGAGHAEDVPAGLSQRASFSELGFSLNAFRRDGSVWT